MSQHTLQPHHDNLKSNQMESLFVFNTDKYK